MFDYFLNKLVELMGPIATLSRERRQLRTEALRAISTALQETKIYYRDQEVKGRDLDREADLVRLWSNAAIPLNEIEPELALACEQKSEFWVNPDNWSSEEIQRFGIKLEDVSAAYRQLAVPKMKVAHRGFKNA